MDENEFTNRIKLLQTRLYRVAFLYLGSESMALDAVSETVYRGFRFLKKLRQSEYFETWITRIIINVCKKELRFRKREQPLDCVPEMQEKEIDSLPLKEAVRHLPRELMEVVILRYFAGYTLAETAKTLGIPQGTVATRQRRALGLLKLELLEEEVHEQE